MDTDCRMISLVVVGIVDVIDALFMLLWIIGALHLGVVRGIIITFITLILIMITVSVAHEDKKGQQ